MQTSLQVYDAAAAVGAAVAAFIYPQYIKKKRRKNHY
jgi:hypothetical protein